MDERPFQRIVLTGAAGRLASVLRASLRELTHCLVLSDLVPPREALAANEIFMVCDLSDRQAVSELLQGAELVVHMGGISQERDFDAILQANLVGQFNLYDNALTHGVKRIIQASSNHVTGYYRIDQPVSPQMPPRPDSLYAVSKCYGEALASFYHDRHGLESVCLRIGSCSPRPRNLRALNSWLSYADLCRLVRCAALAPQAGFAVVYGVSDNASTWWHGDDAKRIGYRPHDSSEPFRDALAAAVSLPDPLYSIWQGGKMDARDYRKPETWNWPPPPISE